MWPVSARKRGTGVSTGFIHSFSWLFWTSVSPADAWVFLRGGLEVVGHRLLKPTLVLPDHAGHAVELFDAPLVGSGDTCGEKRLLRVEDFLKSVHWVITYVRVAVRLLPLEGTTRLVALLNRIPWSFSTEYAHTPLGLMLLRTVLSQ